MQGRQLRHLLIWLNLRAVSFLWFVWNGSVFSCRANLLFVAGICMRDAVTVYKTPPTVCLLSGALVDLLGFLRCLTPRSSYAALYACGARPPRIASAQDHLDGGDSRRLLNAPRVRAKSCWRGISLSDCCRSRRRACTGAPTRRGTPANFGGYLSYPRECGTMLWNTARRSRSDIVGCPLAALPSPAPRRISVSYVGRV